MELLMRLALLLGVVACSPEVASGTYLCGPDALCPVDEACNGPDNTCVLASRAEPFACTPDLEVEPDDTPDQAHEIVGLQCISVPFSTNNCMLTGDDADWVKFAAPTGCVAVEVEARVSFPIAFEELGLELWDLDRNVMVATDGECPQGVTVGERRCLTFTLTGGTTYGIKVHPTGEGNCNGACGYNRYSLTVQLATPG
jgi:hypothetical protein